LAARIHIRSLAILFVLFAAQVLTAQNITSTILGLVTDSSGAGVPGAEITVTNDGTGLVFKTVAADSGAYSAPNLLAGVYTVTVSKAGFQTFKATGVQVQSSQTVRVNAALAVGEIVQNVTVSGEAQMVTTESPTIGATLDTRRINNLPMSQQSIDTLLALTPGAQTSWGASAPNTGGATHWGGTNFTINGVAANDFGNGGGAYSFGFGLISLPPVQSLAEFKVESFNTNAEYRNLGTVTMVTKSGSNAFHGDAYEYLQNKVLNANAFVNNARGQKRPPTVRNQFGVNIGGPIIRNKAFFFFDYSGMRNRMYSTPQLTYPSMAMREGDFSALGTQLFDPWSGLPFANNRIPSSMITSQAKTLVKYLPAPNVATNSAGLPNGGQNYFGLVSTAQDMNAMDVRIDYQIGAKDQLYGVYTRNIGSPWEWYLGFPASYGNASDYGYKTYGVSLVENHTFSPRAINDFRASWFDHPNIRAGVNLDFDPTSLFPQLTKSTNRGLPAMNMTGYTGIIDRGTGFYSHTANWELMNNFTYVRGKHTLKFGASTSTYKSYGPNTNAPLGTFNFSGQWTGNIGWPGQPKTQGNAFADFLLGTANSSSTGLAGVFAGVYWSWDTEFYAQDTWQVTPKLTAYFGMRYMYQTPWNWQNGYSTYWDPGTNRLALPQDSDTPVFGLGMSRAMFDAYNFTTTKALGLPARYMIGDKNNWGPRVGFAYRPTSDNRTVVRAGYGVYYNFNPAYIGARDDVLSPPWVGGLGGFSGSNYSSRISGTITEPFLPDVTFSDPFPAKLQAVAGASKNPTIYAMQRDFKNAVVQQWNLTLERQFSESWAGRITYAGSQTHHLQWFFSDFNVPTVQIPNKPIQDQRPFQPWAGILTTRSGAWQNFNQLQLSASKRFSQGFLFQAEYQWTRSLDNAEYVGGPMIPAKPQLDYGNSANIRRHVLTFHYLYELPVGRGKALLGGINKVADAFIGGWQFSGISTYQTGAPFSVGFQVPSSVTGWWSANNRADVVAGADFYAGQGSGHDVINGIQWFNVNAFAPPQKWQWGNSSRNMLFGPGSWNWDITMAKNFSLGESIKLQLRTDWLNAFNHFNLDVPVATIPDTRDGGPPIANAGRITGGSGSRVIQVGARLSF
jgi:hypothetical protein